MKEQLLKRFCSEQVCILLERMDSHPEEFVNGYGKSRYFEPKWSPILNEGAFNRIEKYLLKSKMFGIRRRQTKADIILVLTRDVTDAEDESPKMSTTSRFSDQVAQKMILNKAQIEMLRNNPYLKPQSNKNP